MPTVSPLPPELRPRCRHGVLEFPVHHMRGGTSTGLVLWQPYAPAAHHLKEELLRHLMGVPLAGRDDGHKQITGLGRGSPTSNKVFFAEVGVDHAAPVIVSTLAQLAGNHGGIDWSVNCGNMSSALQLWAIDMGLLPASAGGSADVRIRNTNTGVLTVSRMALGTDARFATAEIPGVDGAYPAVDLFMQAPAGSKTGTLLPTGAVVDVIGGVPVSCIDVAVPMVICAASTFGKTGYESIAELDADPAFKARLRSIWVAAGLRMRLKRRDGALMTALELERSETIPKICIVAPPQNGGHIAVRYFTPQAGHASMAVSGGCCLAAAALIPGSVAQRVAQGLPAPARDDAEIEVGIENPAGILQATVIAKLGDAGLEVQSAAYRRSTQILLRGHVPLYRASAELVRALLP
jgi:2-methylaconitate cis-trans-isomerase PrpF